MNNSNVLKKAIEKAIKNGYKPDGILGGVLEGRLGVGLDPNIYNHLVADRSYFIYIFSHDFAKAFILYILNERPQLVRKILKLYINVGPYPRTVAIDVVKDKLLQQMVREKQPLKYLSRFLDEL